MSETPNFQHPQPQSNQPGLGQIYGDPSSQPPDNQRIDSLESTIRELVRNHIHDGSTATRINLNTDIMGLFETVTVAPTLTPTRAFDQIKVSVIAGTTKLNVYDVTNNVWKSVTLT